MCEKLSVLAFGLVLMVFVTFTYQFVVGVKVADREDLGYYTAAVVEYTPTYVRGNGPLTLRENGDAYVTYIEEASQHGADIIVFPENGLTSIHLPVRKDMEPWTTVIPSPRDEYIPCVRSDIKGVSETLTKLSCAARKNRIYVVVNIAEKDDIYYHNTNVAFDRTGKIVARYRKVNLYNEPSFDKTKTPEVVTFDTDFGVKFGTFICFDILFSEPALNLTRSMGVSNIVYSTAWFSEVPFLTAIQTQSGWAYSQNVNLIGAGYHQPELGSSGSGIYQGRNGIINATMTSSPKYRLLISRLPKKPFSQTCDAESCTTTTTTRDSVASLEKPGGSKGIKLLHDVLTSFKTVQLQGSSMAETICQNDLCCEFDIQIDDVDSSPINYRVAVFDGVRLYGYYMEGGVRLCGLMQCSNDSVTSCGSVVETNATFTRASIRATFGKDYPTTLTFPSTLSTTLLPLDHSSFIEGDDGRTATITLTRPTSDIVTFVLAVAGMYVAKSHGLHYIEFMGAARDVIAEAQIEVNLQEIALGKTKVFKWRGKPIFVYHRTQAVIDRERAVNVSSLRHPETDDERVKRPEWLVVIGICSHLGCIPIPNSGMIPGGFYCPCHATHFDGSGRVIRGPAPTNMEIPEYQFINDQSILVG